MVTRLPFKFIPLLRVVARTIRDAHWRDLKDACVQGISAALRRRRARPDSSFPAPLLQIATGAWASQALYVAAKLGIADVLNEGPRTCDEIAAATGTPADSLSRLLRALRSLGVIELADQGRFTLTALGRPLRAHRTGSLRALVLTLGEVHYDAWAALLHGVQTGAPAFPRVFGARLFDYLDTRPAAGETFHEAMTEVSALIAKAVLLAYDFAGVHLLVDVGGGRGQFLTAILEVYPHMRGILMDMPTVVDAARKELARRPTAQRCAAIAGDLLQEVPRGANLYLLCGVIHDWNDEDAVRILDNCRRAMTPHARVLLVDLVLASEHEPRFGSLLDLNMLVMTGGRERTEQDFRRLFERAGLTLTQIIPTLAPQSIIEGVCKKTGSPPREAFSAGRAAQPVAEATPR